MSKTLDRISLLLNQAENTTNEAEATAFMEKAQALATAAQIELEVARQHQADKTKREAPTQRKITVAGYTNPGTYYSRQRVQNNAAEMVNLFSTIAGQNNVRINIAHNSTYVIAFGFPSDIDVCEALFASLSVQMKATCDAEVKKGDYKNEQGEEYWCDRDWKWKTRKPDARRFRTSFYQAFTGRIGTRLAAARREAEAVTVHTTDVVTGEAVETTGALVLVPKAVEVADYYKQTSNARGSWKGGNRNAGGSSTGRAAGRAAGDRARIGSQSAIGGSRGSIAS